MRGLQAVGKAVSPAKKQSLIDGTPLKRLKNHIPQPNQIMHPFLGLSQTEKGLLCCTECEPRIREGRSIIPAMVRDPMKDKTEYTHARLQFPVLHNISSWVQEYTAHHRFSEKQLVSAATLPAFEVVETEIPETIRAVCQPSAQSIEGILAAEVVSTEELFQFLLEAYPGRVKAILPILLREYQKLPPTEVHLQGTLHRVLLAFDDKAVDKQDVEAVNRLLHNFSAEVGRRHEHVLNATVLQQLLRFYISGSALTNSRTTFQALLDRGICPVAEVLDDYFLLVEKAISAKSQPDLQARRLAKMACIAGFAPVLKHTMTATMLRVLIGCAAHTGEILKLVEFAASMPSSKTILEGNAVQLVNAVSSFVPSPAVENCINISLLLQRLEQAYTNGLPTQFAHAASIAYLHNGNWGATAVLWKRYGIPQGLIEIPIVDMRCQLPGFRQEDRQHLETLFRNM
ncbi:AaceriADR142Wp [[Ashbya] aceris (nom. inval.)]|nr:AaceriADR142Wp [[Ashbya] aceris (nom. inval.)]